VYRCMGYLAGWLWPKRPVLGTDNAIANTDNADDFSTTFALFECSRLLINDYRSIRLLEGERDNCPTQPSVVAVVAIAVRLEWDNLAAAQRPELRIVAHHQISTRPLPRDNVRERLYWLGG